MSDRVEDDGSLFRYLLEAAGSALYRPKWLLKANIRESCLPEICTALSTDLALYNEVRTTSIWVMYKLYSYSIYIRNI